jgi:Undecaprenyl-phosphate galactose phosphotransferase WbaP
MTAPTPALLDIDVLAPSTNKPRLLAPRQRACKPGLAASLLGLGDLVAIGVAMLGSVLLRRWAGGVFEISLYLRLFPVLGLFTMAYALFGLYPGVTCNPVAEIRRATAATTAVFLALAALTLLFRVVDVYSRLVFLMAWMAALAAVPLARAATRSLFAHKSWWGYPLVIFGAGGMARDLVRSLREQPRLGLRAVAIVDRGYAAGAAIEGVPVVQRVEDAPLAHGNLGILRGVVAAAGLTPDEFSEILNSRASSLPHLLIAPGLEGVSSLETEATDVGRLLMLETRNRLLMPWPQLAKRALDIACTVALAAIALPLGAVVAALIKLDSRGPVFYGHPRIGRDGRRIKVWKFRTMMAGASDMLEWHLRAHPEMAAEWQRNRKLRRDPRVTCLGRFLRRTSLDELPQLWNVLLGDMSLVGPRPIVTEEIEKYSEAYRVYTRVRPGLTGLWQVSGRNDTGYDERVALDTYYVRNWSPWLDAYLLARTVTAVLARAGAY